MVSTLIEKPVRQHHGERAQQRHRHHDRRNDRVAEVLQEEAHHEEDEHHRLDQRLTTFSIETLTKRELSYGMLYSTPGGKKRASSSILARIALGGGQRIAGWRKLHADAGGRLAVQPRRGGVALRAELDAGDVAQAHRRAVGIGAQHDRCRTPRVR